jgi:hypothetical protein
MDIDIQGDVHKKDNLPPTLEAALACVADLPLAPTMIVSTGGGIVAPITEIGRPCLILGALDNRRIPINGGNGGAVMGSLNDLLLDLEEALQDFGLGRNEGPVFWSLPEWFLLMEGIEEEPGRFRRGDGKTEFPSGPCPTAYGQNHRDMIHRRQGERRRIRHSRSPLSLFLI